MKKIALLLASVCVLTAMSHRPSASEIPIPQDKPAAMCAYNCAMSEDGFAHVRRWEGYMPYRYADAVGIMTIGFGHVILPGEKFSEPLMGEEANDLLRKDMAKFQKWLASDARAPLWQHQYDALCALSFNVGRLRNTKTLETVNKERHDEVPEWIKKWNKAGGRILKGLVNRRESEAEMYGGL
ncbi:MAG: lysozyme [Candidatus Binatia bacterium]